MTVAVKPQNEAPKEEGPKVAVLTKTAFRDACRSQHSLVTGKRWVADGRFAVRREIIPEDLEKLLPKDLEDAQKPFWEEKQVKEILRKAFGFEVSVNLRRVTEKEISQTLDDVVEQHLGGLLQPARETEVYIEGARMYVVGKDDESAEPVFIDENMDALLHGPALGYPQTARSGSAVLRADGMAIVMPRLLSRADVDQWTASGLARFLR